MNGEDKFVKELIRALKDDFENWEFGEHTADYKPLKISLWTANGFGYFALYKPFEKKFNRKNTKKLWGAIQDAHFSYLVKKMKGAETDGRLSIVS